MSIFYSTNITNCYKYELREGIYLVFDFNTYEVRSINPMCSRRKEPNNAEWTILGKIPGASKDINELISLDLLVGYKRVGSVLKCSFLCYKYLELQNKTEFILRILSVSPEGLSATRDIYLATFEGEYGYFECSDFNKSKPTRRESLELTSKLSAHFSMSRVDTLGKLSVSVELSPDFDATLKGVQKGVGQL